MEEIEQLNKYKISRINKKGKNKCKINNKTILILIIVLCVLLTYLSLILLALENIRLNNKLQRASFISESSISLNFFNQNLSAKKLFSGNDNNYENINKNVIHVSYSLDDKLVYPTLISMLSGLENCNKDNFIVYHLLLNYKFNTSNIEIFESLKEKYRVKINYYIIPHIFAYSRRWTAGTDCVYYKILLPFMFPDYERMIYLDGDTLIRHDILEMYTYPFGDNYILGFPFYMGYVMGKHGIPKPKHYINGGCLLFNIRKIRKDHKDIDLLSLTIKNNSIWRFREQDAINYAFYPNIGFLPLKYGIYMIGNKFTFKALSGHVYSPLNYTEGYEAVKDPSIIHFSCCWPKVWTNGTKNLFKNHDYCYRFQKEFYFYANKSNYYQIIKDSFFYKKKKR